MVSQGELLAELKKLYALHHDPDILAEIRRRELRINGFARYRNQELYQDQLDALESIANQFNRTVEETVKTCEIREHMITSLAILPQGAISVDLHVPTQLSELNQLHCVDCNIHNIRISTHIRLVELNIQRNQLTAIEIPNKAPLERLYCGRNYITRIVIPPNSNLRALSCPENQLTRVNIPYRTPLKFLQCNSNQLEKLWIPPDCPLQYLNCSDNRISELTVPSSVPLVQLRCEHNAPLKELFLSKKVNLVCSPFIKVRYYD